MKSLPLIARTIGLVLVLAGLVSAGQAQNREKFVISARAGGVNSVLGRVMVTRHGQAAQLLSNQDNLVAGDVVATGQASQAEVLLNPGSYLRVGENSEFSFVDNSLNSLVLKLVKGSAIIEATAGEDADLQINVLANQQHFVIIRSGIYRINVQPGSTELLVRKGRVLTGNPREVVKGGMRVTYAAGGPLTAKLDKKDQDQFDLWSKQRAETLARANQKISNRAVYGYLASMSPFEWAFSAANPWGLWAYSPLSRSYTFMPFHYGWSSPYGHNYGNYCQFWPGGYGYGRDGSIVSYPGSSGGSSTGVPGSSSASGGSSGGGMGSSQPAAPSAPSAPMGSQAGPRDPDSGSRSINRIKDPQ